MKNYIEENDIDWIERGITLEKIKINPLTFVVEVFDIAIKEPNSKADFVSCKNVKVNVDFWPLLNSKISTIDGDTFSK